LEGIRSAIIGERKREEAEAEDRRKAVEDLSQPGHIPIPGNDSNTEPDLFARDAGDDVFDHFLTMANSLFSKRIGRKRICC
jgi:hypothetical protein